MADKFISCEFTKEWVHDINVVLAVASIKKEYWCIDSCTRHGIPNSSFLAKWFIKSMRVCDD
jgi:hypothetical protein